MANIFDVFVAEAADIQQFATTGEKIIAAFPPKPTALSLLAFYRAESADIAAEEATGLKIYQAFDAVLQPTPAPTPTPGPLKALCQGCDVHAELMAAAAKLPAFNGTLLNWLVTNFPTILADVEQIITIFKPTPAP